MYNILVCDDERDIVSALTIYLTTGGYRVYPAYSGPEALRLLETEDIHLVLLDVMMPAMDGITALARLREISNVPVILLTAKSEEEDKILGLGAGADEYITKPFRPREVKARVRSQLRRYLTLGGNVPQPDELRIGGLSLNRLTREVQVDGEPVSLTPKEFEILQFLMSRPGQVFSPREIYENVWHEKPFGSDNTVAVHIRHLREKIEIDPAEPRYIRMLFGQGYKMEEDRIG
jgi:DNA-binding response OmpR family regulator